MTSKTIASMCACAIAALVAGAPAVAAPGITKGVGIGWTVSVAKFGSGTGVVTADSGAINCGATCSGQYADISTITLTATPSGGSQFTGWLGPCTGTGTCTFTVSAATTVTATFASPPLTTAPLDVDGNNDCDALTDGLLALRYLFGLSGTPLTSGAIGGGAMRMTPLDVRAYLVDVDPLLDIDGNGQTDALTDGLLAIRHLFGLEGPPLITGALGQGATRVKPSSIQAQVQLLCTPPPPSFLLTVGKAGDGTGNVSSAPAGIDCGADCTESFVQGTMVSLTPTPDIDSAFDNWSGACTGSGSCTVTMDAAKTVTATFSPKVCDAGIPTGSSDAMQYAAALELCDTTTEVGTAPGLISAALTLASGTGTPSSSSRAIRGSFGNNNIPLGGASMVVLSTGAAAAPGQTNPAYVAAQTGLDTGTSSPAPTDWLTANGGQFPTLPGCPLAIGATAYNPVMLTLRMRVPSNAHSFSLNVKYFGADFPEFVCSGTHDMFVVLLDSAFAGMPANPADKNLAVYTSPAMAKYPVGVGLAVNNSGLFSQCVNGTTGCGAGAVVGSTSSCVSDNGILGTGLDLFDSPTVCSAGSRMGGGTDWLVVRGNVVPGEIITLRIAVWDTSDGIYDSIVLLDKFSWSPNAVTPGTIAR